MSKSNAKLGCLLYLITLAIIFGCFCINGVVWMLIWNYLICYFWVSIPTISFWQGVGMGFIWTIFMDIIRAFLGKKTLSKTLDDLSKQLKNL